jgi:hypothetical protein
MLFIGLEGGFSQKFFQFGPGKTPETTAEFIGIKIDTWSKVIIMYVIGFLTSIIIQYYHTIMNDNLRSYIWNKAIKHIPYTKSWTYIVVILEPILLQLLQIIQLFTTLTMQFQFIIPEFLGSFIAELPFTLRILGTKSFAKI